ncbi:MAG: hypothetical protein DRJ05_12290 [Bacteroidetes bacterium]|nr:MAG: hypothetical protein DRJ05_12290 [Bacteroidota bacterium]
MEDTLIIGLILILWGYLTWWMVIRFRKLKRSFTNSNLIRDLKHSGFHKTKVNEYSKKNKQIEYWFNWNTNRNNIILNIGIEFNRDLNIKENFVKYTLEFSKKYKEYGFNIGGKKTITREFRIKRETDIPNSNTIFNDFNKMIEITKNENITPPNSN